MCIYININICIYIYRERERDRYYTYNTRGKVGRPARRGVRRGEHTVDLNAVVSNCSTEDCLPTFNKIISSNNSN